MKVLYAIQGTGNGHLSRARDIVPYLQKKTDLDILVSGLISKPPLPFTFTYQMKGLGFTFGRRGGVDIWDTLKKAEIGRFLKDIYRLPVQQYDLIINDFEPVSAWAAKLREVPCVALSHQASVLHKKAPKPEVNDRLGQQILKNYAPSDQRFGFHFASYGPRVFTPVVRQAVRQQSPQNEGYYTVYLPAYGLKKLVKKLGKISGVRWEVFSKYTDQKVSYGNVHLNPLHNEAFIKSMANSEGVLCGAGFETPAEALYLDKKLMVIPMKGQYEQQCNAAALRELGVPVLKNLSSKHMHYLDTWIANDARVKVNYPDKTETIIDRILQCKTACNRDENFEQELSKVSYLLN